MLGSVLIKVAVGVALTAGSVAAYHAVDAQISTDPPPATDGPAAEGSSAEPRTERTGTVQLDEDGMRLQLGSRGRSGAGVEMTADGFELWLDGRDEQGRHGAARVGMDDHGFSLWLDGGS